MAPPFTTETTIEQPSSRVSSESDTRPLTDQLVEAAHLWASGQHQLILLAARFADSTEWVTAGSPTAAHWLADVADVETCTAREWIRIGRKLTDLPATANAYNNAEISYSKVRTLTRHATPANETELLDIAKKVPASDLGRAIAYWLNQNTNPEELEAIQHDMRSVKWRTEPDGMILFTVRLQPLIAGVLIALLGTIVMRSKPRKNPRTGQWPTLAQQHADAIEEILTKGAGNIDTEVIIHVRGDGNTLDNGTPITQTAIENIAPTSFIRALIHNDKREPIDATNRRRHPTTRQQRVVKERDRVCVDCGRADLLHYDHVPAHHQTGHTITTELKLRCSPCHDARHDNARHNNARHQQ